ncbi:MAG: hypothetical protein GXY41_12365 [Phycisphaerae bacterium]|nr:hypothetical protein [Phycisphaerae bacterium]
MTEKKPINAGTGQQAPRTTGQRVQPHPGVVLWGYWGCFDKYVENNKIFVEYWAKIS